MMELMGFGAGMDWTGWMNTTFSDGVSVSSFLIFLASSFDLYTVQRWAR